ncbi:type II secretion system minor pseudopilin GspK [Puniceibacterium confluentis]|uniref:type II secretion system minor pseudopilin GspK n=1 Tax=Puniceibacterium confluentis TaxID=1958944 RepID=UPI0011B5BB44|nr:type II secretion system minor pseudopilin GspK [Puniceibacterium confluentis]
MSPRNRGFVLVNALVLVAALAGIAVLLLGRAEGARARLAETQGAAQIGLYLDAFEALAVTLLAADRAGGAADHLREPWARAEYDVPLDRGRVAGSIRDLQGRFNINWLANVNSPRTWESFHLLLQRLALPSSLGDEIAGFLSPDGPVNTAPYARQNPAIRPVGGPVLLLDQLRGIPALQPRDFDRLQPFLAALPGESTLNVNTAPAEVLQVMIPGLATAVTDRLVQSRTLAPFVSMEDFVDRMVGFGATSGLSEEDLPRFGVGSRWFGAEIAATLEGRERHRTTVFERLPLPGGVRVAYRLDQVP